MAVKVRFAPSPTGFLHIGNVRTALLNWLLAKSQGGEFLLRMDDTDLERSTKEFADGIREDLTWLGMHWDEEKNQASRLERYEEIGKKLEAEGLLYACYETPEELEYKRRRQRSRGLPPIYDREGETLTAEQKAAFEAEGRKAHWRFKLKDEEIAWDDMARGRQSYQGSKLSDPVVRRADGSWLYMLPSVIDDIDFGITHVLRGEDHVTNTAVQMQMFDALGAPVPTFAHVPLITGPGGEGMSKRLGTQSIREFREQGIYAAPLLSMMASLGTSFAADPSDDLAKLAEKFDVAAYGRAQPQFDPAELSALSTRYLHEMDFATAQPKLEAVGLTDATEAFWVAVRANLAVIEDAKLWWDVINAEIDPVIEDADVTAAAAAALPEGAWDETTWGALTKVVKEQTGKKGKGLFHPLRLALTGQNNGPELKVLLPMIGRERAQARLEGKKA